MLNSEQPILLAIEDDVIRKVLELTFSLNGLHNIKQLGDFSNFHELISKQHFAFVVFEVPSGQAHRADWIQQTVERAQDIPLILCLETEQNQLGLEAIHAGVFDYLLKPIDTPRLIATATKALELLALKRENSILKYKEIAADKQRKTTCFASFFSQDPVMDSIFRYCEALAPSQETLLLQGEPGVGKQTLAESIHKASGRPGPFLAQSLKGVNPGILQEFLFSSQNSLFRQAQQGTLLFKDVDQLSAKCQTLFLRLVTPTPGTPNPLQEHQCRLLVAAGRDFRDLMEEGRFRRDLYHLISAYSVMLPPLRQRKNDLRLLVEHFLMNAARAQKKKKPTVPKELYSILKSYFFPGNVKELKGLIESAMEQHRQGMLSLALFKPLLGEEVKQLKQPEGRLLTLSSLNLKDAKDAIIQAALEQTNQNQTLAAEMLGFSRQALSQYLKLQRL